MRVTNFQVEHQDGHSWTLSANVAAERIYFTYQGIEEPANIAGDAFLMAALIPAMRLRETLFVDKSVPVSPQLLKNLVLYQEIYRHWYPEMKEISVEAENLIANEQPGQKSGCFFSGGVDSIYTVSKTLDQLDYLVLCWGLDIPIHEHQRWEKTHGFVKKFADNLGLKLITVTTNVKEQLRCWDVDNQGAILISNAIALGFEKLFVPASHAWDELFPCGSHPVIDPVLGNGRTQVVHHGNVFRTEKTEEIIRFGHGVDDLRVCNVYSDYNCGKCEKCLRTMVCLELLNKRLPALPTLTDIEVLKNMRVEGYNKLVFWQDNHRLAVKTGNSTIADAIAQVLKRYQRRELLKEFDRVFFNQRLVRLKRRFI